MSSTASLIFVASAQDDLAHARTQSLWRALCHLAEVWRVDVHAEQVEGASEAPGRNLHADLKSLPQVLDGLRAQSHAGLVVLATPLAPVLAGWPQLAGCRLVVAPPRPSALEGWVPPAGCDPEIWVRTAQALAQLDDALRGRARVIADGFEPPFVPAAPVDPEAIAVLIDPEAGRDEIRALATRLDAAGEGRAFGTMAAAQALHRVTGRPASLVEVETEQEALSRAARWAFAGGADACPYVAARAAVAGRTLLGAEGSDAAAALSLDPTRVLAEVGAALGGVPEAAGPSLAERLRRNLDLAHELSQARFHPWVRLFRLSIEATGAVSRENFTAELTAPAGAEPLQSTWILPAENGLDEAKRSLTIRAGAVLPRGVALHQVEARLKVWGTPVARLKVPEEDVTAERAGLIGMNLSVPGRARVTYWGDADTVLQCGRSVAAQPQTRQKRGRPATFRAETGFPFNRESLATYPVRGEGQRFTAFSVLTAPRLPSSKRLDALHNRYLGRSAWLIGDAAGALTADFERLAIGGHLCFGLEAVHAALQGSTLRPAFTLLRDRRVIAERGQEIVGGTGGTVFVAGQAPPALTGDYVWLREDAAAQPLFSFAPQLFVTPGGSALHAALQVGYYLGIRKWYVYGFDFSFPGARAPEDLAALEEILPSLHAARQLMEMDGGFIRNAAREGAVEALERIEFEAAMSEDAPAASAS